MYGVNISHLWCEHVSSMVGTCLIYHGVNMSHGRDVNLSHVDYVMIFRSLMLLIHLSSHMGSTKTLIY